MTVSKEEMAVAFATDVDGTLVLQSGLAMPGTGALLRALAALGLKVGPATGKGADYCQALAVAFRFPFDHINAENGAHCLRLTSTAPLHWQAMDGGERSSDLELFAKLIEMNEIAHTFVLNDRKVRFTPQLKMAIRTLLPPGTDVSVTEVWLEYFERIILENNLDLEVMRFADGGIDIIPAGVNKGLGVDLLCELYNCRRRQILTFGDSQNDYELLRGTLCTAVGNARQEIKDFVRDQGGYVSTYPHILGVADGLCYYARQGYLPESIINVVNRLFGEHFPQPQR